MVRVEAAEPLIHLFSETLGLPVSWPLQRTSFATYAWITVGNTNLEFWAAANNDDLPVHEKPPLFHGFALDPPSLPHSLAVLEKRGIACKAPRPFVTSDSNGRQVTNFTNSVVLDVSTEACCIFFCEWGAEGTIFPWSEKLTTVERQVREQQKLSSVGGGSLGVTGLVEIRMSAPEVGRMKAKWKSITGQSSDSFHLGRGVALSLSEGKSQKIESIVFGVRSLPAARSFLAEKNLLELDEADEISIAKRACANLSFRLREANVA